MKTSNYKETPEWLFIYLHEFINTGNISNIVYDKMFIRIDDTKSLLIYDSNQPEYSDKMKIAILEYAKEFGY